MALTAHDIAGVFRYLEGCCLHNPQWQPEEVEEVLAGIWNSYGEPWQPVSPEEGYWKDHSDSESAFAVRLSDGSYGLLTEGEDYTGHGCQCGSFTGRYASLDELLQHCEDDYRDAMRAAIESRASG